VRRLAGAARSPVGDPPSIRLQLALRPSLLAARGSQARTLRQRPPTSHEIRSLQRTLIDTTAHSAPQRTCYTRDCTIFTDSLGKCAVMSCVRCHWSARAYMRMGAGKFQFNAVGPRSELVPSPPRRWRATRLGLSR
jgi:hypothetical protein